jgi:hypothetical protein
LDNIIDSKQRVRLTLSGASVAYYKEPQHTKLMPRMFDPITGEWTEYEGDIFKTLNLERVEYTAGQRITAPPLKAVYTLHHDDGGYLEKGNRLVNREAVYIGDISAHALGTQWEL